MYKRQPQFYFFTRWGRTGTSGSCNLEGPFDELEDVSTLFANKFFDKTGNQWDVDDHEDRYIVRAGTLMTATLRTARRA